MFSLPPAQLAAKLAAKMPLAAKWRHLCHWRHGGKVAAQLGGKVAAWRHGGMAAKWRQSLAAKWRHGGMAAWRQSGGKAAAKWRQSGGKSVAASHSVQFSSVQFQPVMRRSAGSFAEMPEPPWRHGGKAGGKALDGLFVFVFVFAFVY
eukprot:gene17505-biopygen10683